MSDFHMRCKNLKKFNEGSRMKKVALTLIAQQLKDEDLEQLRNTFLVLDKNKDWTDGFFLNEALPFRGEGQDGRACK